MSEKVKNTPMSDFHRQLLLLIDEMEACGILLFYYVEEGGCRLSVNDGDEPIAIVKQYFPRATVCSGGGGSKTYRIPEFDGSIPDGFRGEAIVDEARRFRFLNKAQWVEISKTMIFVWHGTNSIEMYGLNGLGHMTMELKGEVTLERVREAIAEHKLRRS